MYYRNKNDKISFVSVTGRAIIIGYSILSHFIH